MTRLVRWIGALVSLLVLVLLVAALGLFVLLGTPTGEAFVQGQTKAALGRLFGPAYDVSLGSQRFEIRKDGILALSWDDVALHRRDRPELSSEIGRVSVAVRLLPLVGGSLEFGRLEIEKARIDLAAFGETPSERYQRNQATPVSQSPATATPEPAAPMRSRISRTAESAIRTLERQLQALQAYHFDTVAFGDITIEGFTGAFARVPDLHIDRAELHRGLDGSLSLYARFDVAGRSLSLGGAADFDPDSARLQSLSLRSGEIDLAQILPPAADGDTKDERPFGSDASLSLEAGMHRQAQTGMAVLGVTIRSGAGRLQLGLNHTKIEPSTLRVEYREGEDRVQILSSPLRFEDVGFDLEGTVEPVLADGATDPERLKFRVGSKTVRSKVGLPQGTDKPLEASVWVDGLIDPVAQSAEITKLDLETQKGRLTGNAIYRGRADTDLTMLRLDADNLSAPSVKAFWPFIVSGKARSWVLGHVGNEGSVPSGSIRIDVARSRLGEAFKPGASPHDDELQLDLELRNMDLSTVGTVPRLEKAAGRLETRGGTTTIFVDQAGMAEHPDLKLGPATVALRKPDEGDQRDLQIDLALAANGPLRDGLEVADAEPIHALRSLDLDPDKVTGQAAVQVEARLRLGDAIPVHRQVETWSVEADLDKVDPNQPIQGRRVSKLDGVVRVIPGQASGSLDGDVEGLPGQIAFLLPFGEKPVGERRIDVSATIPAKKAAEFVPALKGVLGGSTKAELTQTAAGLSGALDLRDATLDLPFIAWKKGAGVPATLSFQLAQSGGETSLRDVALKGEGFSANGSVTLDNQGLSTADLSRVSLNPGDEVAVKVTRHRNGYGIEVKGSQFDARPILAELRAGVGKKDRKVGGGTFDVNADVETLNGFNGQILRDFAMNYASVRGRMAALNLSGTAGGGAVSGDLSPRGELQAIRLRSADLGALLGFAGLYQHMQGGQASLDLLGTADTSYDGALQIQNFTLVDEPRLSRIVGSSGGQETKSLSQAVGQNLQTERAFFDQASAKLSYAGSTLRVADGIVRGPVFGSSFNGTLYNAKGQIDISGSFMPAYGLNRMFGAIPVLGQILGNGNEGGLIGITYRLDGPFSAPTLVVNPISVIAPGIFRQIFSYQ
ncbi:AsmA-like C-terminal region-containing protein [Aureimonas ureilytica]|uniref:AsmA-like C-terminal region-containing protein n=1 Tax=Aureimonas ureilytica TaxID=401562 RepID=UPI003CE7E018